MRKEFGPPTGLTKRRIWGAVLIVAVLGFLDMVVSLFGSGEPGGAFAETRGPVEEPSMGMFVLKACGLLVVALLVPWLATGGGKSPPEEA